MNRFQPTNLRSLGTQFEIPIKPDEDGYLGRECPIKECLGYFKITPGTGVKGPAPCHCPYCGNSGESRTFFTQEQIEYARSIVLRKVTDAIHKDLKSLEFEHKPQGMFGIGISMKVQASARLPIRYYREKELETAIVCDSCTLRYAIYGVFGWCPDCGVHNSLQILAKNLELARKELTLAASAEAELANHLIGDALENAVSAFDGFGRELCARKSADIRFQSVLGARRKVQDTFGFDFADGLRPDEWECACRVFQKRHLLAHKMGVIDEDYLQKANDPDAVLGRRIRLTEGEVQSAITIVESMGRRLFAGILPPTP
ncbi:MAG: hypothetical protein JWQ87_2415 [Candidatus Sulfotelmatobacter sp.]|nr:hypothetical protein [Candidatus Sulfotelmatobacter sp.]